jgi:hypothetical protein
VNVYAIKARGIFGGGMAIVAAPTRGAAMQIAANCIQDDLWCTDYTEPTEVELFSAVQCNTEVPLVLVHFETGE